MTLWGGRFTDSPDEALWRFTVDTSDRRMLVDDVTGSLAHVAMLGEVGLLEADEVAALRDGLDAILAEADAVAFEWKDTDEDVHTAVERRLGELIGEVAGKLHTGRSRNDQVALDLRMYLRRAGHLRAAQLRRLAAVLADAAEQADEMVVPSYTHLQQAQAVPFAHHLLAYAWMLLRDVQRFESAITRIDVSPLGAGASGGSSLPLDPGHVASHLDFGEVFTNSLDAVSSRDFVAEYAFCAAQAMAHLSRLSEELILWSTAEFGWATYDDRHTTGSSALPQKKNPDIAELARGKAAGAIGSLTSIMALQKALPLAYNRDLQEDKEHVFSVDDALGGTLEAITAMLSSASFHPPRPSSWTMALDFAEVLVDRGVPFRRAHEAVGRLVSSLLAEGRTLDDVSADDLSAADALFEADDVALADAAESIRRRVSSGGGSFESVGEQIRALQRLLS